MSRTIKMSAWDKENKKMYYSPSFYDLEATYSWFHILEDYDIADGTITLLQYTGLKDKNGKEIYEGDIIEIADKYDDGSGPPEYAGERLEVKWGKWDGGDMECETWILVNKRFSEYGEPGNSPIWDGTIYGQPIVVIGNIYSNPELLPIMTKK